MINVGLRPYVWSHEYSVEQRVHRELWQLNGFTYNAYRSTLESRKTGLPYDVGESCHAEADRGPQRSLSPYTFTGVANVFDQGQSAVTALQFSLSQPPRLAWGSSDGSVRVVDGEEPFNLLQEFHEHKAPVTSIAWSQGDTWLLTADAQGGVSLRKSDTYELARTFLFSASAVAGCCFHQFNSNIVVVACESGELDVVNCSTGTHHESGKLKQTIAGGISAILNVGNLYLVADCRGAVQVWRSEVSSIACKPLQKMAALALPVARGSKASCLSYTGFSSLAQGPAVLVTYTNQLLCLLRLDAQTGKLCLVAQAAPPMSARNIGARFCPLATTHGAEHLAMGGEDRGVHIYALTKSCLGAVDTMEGHLAPVTDACWSSGGTVLASADCSGTVILWKRRATEHDAM